MAEDYSGLLGAYPFAFRESGSWLFRSYVLVSGLVGAYVVLLIALALVTWIANPTGRVGERTLLGVLAMLVLGPLFAPVLVVARRRRRAGDERDRVDAALALAGYGFLLSLYLALFISDPSTHPAPGALAPVVAWLDSLPAVYGLVPPVGAVALLASVGWLTRPAARA